jgi:hypothetical protein
MANELRTVPVLFLEQLALGELSEPMATAVRRRIAEDSAAQEHLRNIEAANGLFLSRFPPDQEVPRIRQRATAEMTKSQGPTAKGRFAFAIASIAVVAVAALLVPLLARAPSGLMPTQFSNRLKGLEPKLIVHLKTAAGAELLADGSFVRAGDVLQVSYVAAGHRYGAIVSVDGTGQVTLHYPKDSRAGPVLQPSGEVPLPFGYQLDSAPRFERFFLVVSDRPFSVDDVIAAAHRVGVDDRLPLPGSFGQAFFTVNKAQR